MAAASPKPGTPPVKASSLRSGEGSRNFSTVRTERAKEGLERDLAHKVDCGLSAIVTTACATPLDDLAGIRKCLSHGDNLRMKTSRGNRETDRAGERIIASVARGDVDIEELRKPAVRSKAKQMLRSLRAGVFDDCTDDTVAVKTNKARHRDVIKAVVQYSLKSSPDRDQYVLPQNNDGDAAAVMRQLAQDYGHSTSKFSKEVEDMLTPPRAREPRASAKAASSAKDPPSSTSSEKKLHIGPKGGAYYLTASGNKRYVDASPSERAAAVSSLPRAPSSSGRAPSSSGRAARRLDFTEDAAAPAKARTNARVAAPTTSAAASDQLYTGPRGGLYRLTSGGNKAYVSSASRAPAASTRPTAPVRAAPSYSTAASSRSSGASSGGGRTVHTGPRGGQYYINGNGNKTYVRG